MKAFEQDIKKCIAALEKGGTILYPTDTIWGLGCDATNPSAIENISDIKNRPTNKSYIVLVKDEKMLEKYIEKLEHIISAILAQQKKATTIIYEKIKGIAPNALAADGSLGMRIPDDDFCQKLLQDFGKPIISTSANLSGEPNPAFYKEINPIVVGRVDYVCSWRQNDVQAKAPSSILKLNADGTIAKIR